MVCVSTAARSDIVGDRTFMATRDELAYQAVEWVTNNHFRTKKSRDKAGALFTMSPYFSTAINGTDIATYFGMGTSGQITVTQYSLPGTNDTFETVQQNALYSFNIDHSPNSDGSTVGQTPMSGPLLFKPSRQSYGVLLSWDQSFEGTVKGLRGRITIPVGGVSSTLNPDASRAKASNIPTTDGPMGATLTDYFSGNLSKSSSVYSNVMQKPLLRGKISTDRVVVVGLGDIDARLLWQCYAEERFNLTVGASIQIPAGNVMTNEYLFEPQLGARGHVALGANGLFHINAYENDNDLTIGCDIAADFKYFFDGTERRMATLYDINNKVMLPASPYRLVMRHLYCMVHPAANVLSMDHTIESRCQLDALLGISVAWKNVTVDAAYNLYWHQAETATPKTTTLWTDDTYALAHNHYSMYPLALGTTVLGGTSTTDSGGTIVRHSATTGTGSYSDANSPLQKHFNYIGANNDGSSTAPLRANNAQLSAGGHYPGAFTSMNGPIQKYGHNLSALTNRTPTSGTGVDAAGTGYQPVNYNVYATHTSTPAQITHSLVAGIGYRATGQWPCILGLGGLVELQESNRNNALETIRVWAKLGFQF